MTADSDVRVLVADDQELVRIGLRLVLQARVGIDVVGEARDGLEAVRLVEELRPDVVLMDVRMPHLDGIAALSRIRQRDLAPKVIMLTTFDLDDYVFRALRAGAAGFLLKDASREQLVEAIEVVQRGDALLAPSVTRRLIQEYAASGSAVQRDEAAVAALTRRERDTLALVARGLSNAEIAQRLVVTEATVKSHMSAVLTKLGLRDRVQAVVFAYEHGLVVAGEPED
ncbi:response regulator transcription factor [Nocardioides endophyticus]|uniref:Response regulator transcription factor n=1 Tax=Nocardioides endophyticus TaxID=1353775 RepID=A0ABP8Z688_9ACTN